MSLNLIVKEIKSNLKGAMIVGISVALYVAFSLSMYSIMKENIAKVTDLYSAIPAPMREAFNFRLNLWTNVLAFYATYFVFYVPVITGCYAIILGTKLLSKEEQNKTAEFLLSRPLTRAQIVSSKLMVFFLNILGINLLIFLVGLVSCGVVSNWDFDLTTLAILHSYGLLICLLFGMLGFFITVLMKRAKPVVGAGVAIVLGSYFFDMAIRVADRFQFLLFLTPFKYIDLEVFAEDYGFAAWRLLYFVGVSAVLVFLSFMLYKKKDILI